MTELDLKPSSSDAEASALFLSLSGSVANFN
jgi:hypothetical protein